MNYLIKISVSDLHGMIVEDEFDGSFIIDNFEPRSTATIQSTIILQTTASTAYTSWNASGITL